MGEFLQISIGTAQFGLNYGFANQYEKVEENEVNKIFCLGNASRHNEVDTAPSYGDAELVIGKIEDVVENYRITTKLPNISTNVISSSQISTAKNSFTQSLARLRVKSIDGLLIHHGTDLLKSGGEQLFDLAQELREKKLVSRIGVSVYTDEPIIDILNLVELDFIQLPLNLFDQTLLENGTLEQVANRGIEIEARSVFLQGILTMSTREIPAPLSDLRPLHQRLTDLANKLSVSQQRICLDFLRSVPQIKNVIIGVNTEQQLKDIVMNVAQNPLKINYSQFSVQTKELVNPKLWCF